MSTKLKKSERGAIIIGGGVGPMAGVKLHEKIIALSKTSGRDQDHLDVIHLSRSRLIEDRTGFLLGNETHNPGQSMAHIVAAGLSALLFPGEEQTGPIAAGIPCNTFHAPPVWERYNAILAEKAPGIRTVHMLDAAIRDLDSRFTAVSGAGVKPLVGILSTRGTAKSGVWKKALEDAGYRTVEVDENTLERVHESIYNLEWGLKAVTPASDRARAQLEEAASLLCSEGAQAVILGCTEIPLALEEGVRNGVIYIDPVTSLAAALIRAAGGETKQEYP
jgi:aspartate racemase